MSDCLKRDRLRSLAQDAFKHPKAAKCLDCGQEQTHSTGANDARIPSPGDIGICFGCGHVMAFADDLTFRALSDDEIVAVAGNPLLVDMQRVIAEARKLRGGDLS